MVMLMVMVTSTSPATTPEHGSVTLKVCTEVGTEPVEVILSLGGSNTEGVLDASTFIAYKSCNKIISSLRDI
jgi:hypothetical protein